jgi:hypothetical protein
MGNVKFVATLVVWAFLLASCGGGGGGGSPNAVAPSAPSGTSAMPANDSVAVSWTGAPGATRYNVYSSPASPVTKAAPRTSVTSTTATVPSLANGTPVYIAVAAVNAGGESALSNEACAVPTAASTGGLNLYDPFCAGRLDGMKWVFPAFTRGVVNGAMRVSADVSNTEAFAARGKAYVTNALINAGTQRVTTLKADVRVPASSATRTGGAEIVGGLSLQYQPPALRLAGDTGNLATVRAQLGLLDAGSGLRVARVFNHCDNASCSSLSTSGAAFNDPAGFDTNGEAPAEYDATYTLGLSLDEATGIFTWSVSGNGLVASGTMDPTAYVAANLNWSALGAHPFAVTDVFESATLRARVLDRSTSGGSSGHVSAEFDNVYVGLDGLPAVLWDDFSAAGGNSGPTQLSAASWIPGEESMLVSSGALTQHARVTNAAVALSYFQGLVHGAPASVNTLQADFTVTSCANSAGNTNRASLEMNIYNDGSAGSTPPNTNQPGSIVGDVRAYLYLDCMTQDARFQVLRWDSNSPVTATALSNSGNNAVPMGAAPFIRGVHTLRMGWDPVARRLTFQVDGQSPVVVDPTTANTRMTMGVPYVKAPNAPLVQLGAFLRVPTAGESASIDFNVNNVFTAP